MMCASKRSALTVDIDKTFGSGPISTFQQRVEPQPSTVPSHDYATYRSAKTAMPATPARTTCAEPRVEPAFLEMGLAEGEDLAVPVVANEVVAAPDAVG